MVDRSTEELFEALDLEITEDLGNLRTHLFGTTTLTKSIQRRHRFTDITSFINSISHLEKKEKK